MGTKVVVTVDKYMGTVYGDSATFVHSTNGVMKYSSMFNSKPYMGFNQRRIFVCLITECFMRPWKILFVDFLAWMDTDGIKVNQESYDKKCFNTWCNNMNYGITIGNMPWRNWPTDCHMIYTHIAMSICTIQGVDVVNGQPSTMNTNTYIHQWKPREWPCSRSSIQKWWIYYVSCVYMHVQTYWAHPNLQGWIHWLPQKWPWPSVRPMKCSTETGTNTWSGTLLTPLPIYVCAFGITSDIYLLQYHGDSGDTNIHFQDMIPQEGNSGETEIHFKQMQYKDIFWMNAKSKEYSELLLECEKYFESSISTSWQSTANWMGNYTALWMRI